MVENVLDVEMEDPLKAQMSSFVHNHCTMPDISALDQKIYDIVDQINEWKTRRDFYVRFADNPQEFINKWLISQNADLKVRKICFFRFVFLFLQVCFLCPEWQNILPYKLFEFFLFQIMTDVCGDSEQERRADYYNQSVIQEGAFRYIYYKVQQKRAELESTLGIKNN